MIHKSAAAFVITICLLIETNGDQSLDCRKLVYSRNCRGVAIKRGDARLGGTQPVIPNDTFSLKRLMYELNPSSSESTQLDVDPELLNQKEQVREVQATESALRNKDRLQLNQLLYKLFASIKRRSSENDNLPQYEY